MHSLAYWVVLDFEATCDDKNPPKPQEIIEFPSVLVSTESLEIVDEIESFVRPTHHPTLTPFCTELTSIQQAEVDGAPTFGDVLQRHMQWLESHQLPLEGELSWAFVTCGDWDLKTMLPRQLKAAEIEQVPQAYREWINIKVPFRAWRGKSVRIGMTGMLEALGLELEGRHHRGIDDCRNIAKIAIELHKRGQSLEVTGTTKTSAA